MGHRQKMPATWAVTFWLSGMVPWFLCAFMGRALWHGACYLPCMIDGLFASANYEGVKKMLDASVLRHEAIASNLANVETPHYKRVDVQANFASELSRAISSGSHDSVRRMQPSVGVDLQAVAQNRDGNSVQLEKEMVYLQQNMMAHQFQSQMITGSLNKLRRAINTNGA